jgi:hypothetical protein
MHHPSMRGAAFPAILPTIVLLVIFYAQILCIISNKGTKASCRKYLLYGLLNHIVLEGMRFALIFDRSYGSP